MYCTKGLRTNMAGSLTIKIYSVLEKKVKEANVGFH